MVMMMDELELYIYSTETYLQKGLIKVGHSKLGRHKERIREQFGTSNPEQPIILWTHNLPNGKTDKHIHAQLIKNGIDRVEDSPGQEWFKATTQDVKKAFNQVVYSSSRVDNYIPRKEQQDAIDQAKKWFTKEFSAEVYKSSTHQNRFLLNAKMRFGKCFTGLHIAKSIGAKNTLICSYKPEVIGEWMDTVNGHVDFTGWMGVRAKKKNGSSIDPALGDDGSFPPFDGPRVLCVSLQDLNINVNGETKKRLEKVLETKWDLIIFDEVHYGSRTERAKHILNSLESTFRLDLSGTPFRLIQEDDFCPQQVFTYSYLDEKRNKEIERSEDPKNVKSKIYREMPDLNISTIDITTEDIKQQRETFLSDDLDFSLNELFKATSKGFIYEDAVDHFLNGLVRTDHDARACSVFGKLGSQLGVPAIRHTVWWLARVDSIQALVKKLKKHPYFCRFEIINASGSETAEDNIDDIIARDKAIIEKEIKNSIADSSKLGTITLTVRRFLTGTTIKEWDSILVLNDAKSAESYYQAIFRVQSAWVNRKEDIVIKPKAWVFDFAITRCLRLTYEYANALADQLEQNPNQDPEEKLESEHLKTTIQGLCDTLDIKRFYEGSLISNSTSSKDILDALNLEGSRISLAKRITSDALVGFGSLRLLEENEDIFEILKRIKGYRTQDIGNIGDYVQIGLEASELNKKKEEKKPLETDDDLEANNEEFIEYEKDKEKRSRKRWFATQIKRLAICMADFIYITYEREYNIREVIETKAPEFFKVVTGITKEEFALLCEKGFINQFKLNQIVREFREQEVSSLSPEIFILEAIEKQAA